MPQSVGLERFQYWVVSFTLLFTFFEFFWWRIHTLKAKTPQQIAVLR